jgi:hypothetical protein
MDTNIACALLDEQRDFEGAQLRVDIEGMSSPKVCAFLNALVSRMEPDEQYLEIGTWKGRTLVSAALGNRGRVCIGCDYFRFWGKFTGPGVIARHALYRNLRRYQADSAEIRFYRMKSRDLFERRVIGGRIGVYFYDGDHSYAGTRHGVTAAAPLLSRRSVLVMDDWRDPEIRRATHDGIAAAGLRQLWCRELYGDRHGGDWWNGLGVFYLERPPH